MEGWGIRRDEAIMWCLCGPSQSRPAMQQSAGRGREISQNKNPGITDPREIVLSQKITLTL